jgi:hypothetical protein
MTSNGVEKARRGRAMVMRLLPRSCSRLHIFLSYAHEDYPLAEKIAHALRNEGHTVFFDKHDIKAGEDFDARIRETISNCDRFVFLLSRNTLDEGSYTLTELRFARERWPAASGAVLPVIIDKELELKAVPAYLTSVHVFQPEGNIPAETANEIAKGAGLNRWCKACLVVALALIFGAGALVAVRTLPPASMDVALSPLAYAHFRPASQPPEDWKTNTTWLKSPAMLLLAMTYSHRTDPGKSVRIERERVDLQVGDKVVHYEWIYRVDMRDACPGTPWLCAVGPAEAQVLEPGATIARETMYQPDPSAPFSYGDLVAALRDENVEKLTLSLFADMDFPERSGARLETRELICQIDVKAARDWLTAAQRELGQVPRWFRRECSETQRAK